MNVKHALACAIGMAVAAPALSTPATPAAPVARCNAGQTDEPTPTDQPVQVRGKVSKDTAETLAAVERMDFEGGAAPSPEIEAIYDQMIAMMESEDDADSHAAAAVFRKKTGRPPAARTPATKAAGAAPRC